MKHCLKNYFASFRPFLAKLKKFVHPLVYADPFEFCGRRNFDPLATLHIRSKEKKTSLCSFILYLPEEIDGLLGNRAEY
jgi:hypothetical protein